MGQWAQAPGERAVSHGGVRLVGEHGKGPRGRFGASGRKRVRVFRRGTCGLIPVCLIGFWYVARDSGRLSREGAV